MIPRVFISSLIAMSVTNVLFADAPKLPGVGAAMQQMIDAREIAGAVTLVTSNDQILHLEPIGWSNIAADEPMRTDTVFWIASMTKPLAAVAILMLQDEGKLTVDDPVTRFIPDFAELKTPSGQPADITLTHLLTHTSGMGEGSRETLSSARTLADMIPAFLAAPMQFEPGERWQYCQSGINTASRIVEIVTGQAFDQFLEERLFAPLGMTDTTFYPSADQASRTATAYARSADGTSLEPASPMFDPATRDRPPMGHAGLFSTAPDYARFCQMLLNNGELEGRRFLTAESVALLATNHTGDRPAGFVPGSAWGLATSLVREPQGVTAMLSPGTFGHGGLYGTQAWIDPQKGVAYILMVQRTNFPNSDASSVRQIFQQAAADAMAER